MPLPYPDNLTPTGGDLILIQINEYWFSLLLGVFAEAAMRQNWQVTDEEWVDVYQAILDVMSLGEDVGMTGALIDVRISNTGLLEALSAGSENWVSKGDVNTIDDVDVTTLPSGSDATAELVDSTLLLGIPRGDEGLQGVEGNIAELVATTDYADVAEDVTRCSMAMGLGQYLVDKFFDALDTAEAIADAVSAVDSFLALFPPAYLVADQVLDYYNEIIEGSVNALREWLDTETIEKIQQTLFCTLPSDGILTEEVWMDFKAAYIVEFASDALAGVFYIGLNAYENDAIVKRAPFYSSGYETSLCDSFLEECPQEWEHYFDFTVSNQGFFTFDIGANYVAAEGWTFADGQVDVTYYRQIAIAKAFIGDVGTITSVVAVHEVTQGTIIASADTHAIGVSGSLTTIDVNDALPSPLVWSGEIVDPSNVAVVRIYLDVMTSNARSGSGYVRGVTVRGEGTVDPFA